MVVRPPREVRHVRNILFVHQDPPQDGQRVLSPLGISRNPIIIQHCAVSSGDKIAPITKIIQVVVRQLGVVLLCIVRAVLQTHVLSVSEDLRVPQHRGMFSVALVPPSLFRLCALVLGSRCTFLLTRTTVDVHLQRLHPPRLFRSVPL